MIRNRPLTRARDVRSPPDLGGPWPCFSPERAYRGGVSPASGCCRIQSPRNRLWCPWYPWCDWFWSLIRHIRDRIVGRMRSHHRSVLGWRRSRPDSGALWSSGGLPPRSSWGPLQIGQIWMVTCAGRRVGIVLSNNDRHSGILATIGLKSRPVRAWRRLSGLF